MSARDELRELLADNTTITATVDAILAAGYRKPRTITTAEELEELFRSEANVVLLDEDGISLQNLAGGWQAATGSRRLMTSDLTFHCFGPTFTVLHEAQA